MRFRHQRLGVNSRMDEIMAGFLTHRCESIATILSRRVQIAALYHSRLATLADRLVLPAPAAAGRCYYMYVVRTPLRDALAEHLESRGIGTQVYYPRVLPDQRAFQKWARPEDRIENSRRASRENLALPIYPHLTDPQVATVCDAVHEFFT